MNMKSRGVVGCLFVLLLISSIGAADDHAIVAPDGTSPPHAGTVFQAVNQENDFIAQVTGSAVRIVPAFRAERSWTVDVELLAFGLDGEERPLTAAAVSSAGGRVVDRYGALSRLVGNSAAGLDQVFTIAEGPTGERRKDPQILRIGIVHPTSLASELGKNGRRLRFADESGAFALALAMVRAVDASGASVPARLEYQPQLRSLVRSLDLIVEGAGASYPLEITLRASRLDDPSADEVVATPSLPIKKIDGASDKETSAASSVLVAPPNDTCGGAEVIPGAGPFPYLTALTADITDATTAGDPSPLAGCPIGTPSPSRGIWYTFIPAASGAYTIATCADAPTGSTVDDTLLDVYTSSTGNCGGVMTPIACDDDACTGENLQSVLTTNLTAGTPYFIVVHKWDNVAPTAGNTAIQLRVTLSTPPANDSCVGATALSLNIPKTGTTLAAANDYTLSGSGCFSLPSPPTPVGQVISAATGRDVVYSFTPTAAAGRYSFRVRNVTGGVNPVLYVVNSCPPPPTAIPTPPCLGAANRRLTTPPVAEEVMCLPITGGTTVYAFVDDNTLTGGGNFTIEVNDCVRESESNDAPATANNIAGVCGIEASSDPGGNVDFYSLGPVAPGSRIFAFADNTANNTGDHELRVTTASDTYEYDDDDGDVVFGASGLEPLVAGTNFTPGGTAFLRVNPFSNTILSEPYRLYHVEQPPAASAVPETEPNDPPNVNSAAANYFSGVTTTTDQDDYAFSAVAGDLIYVSVDNDPDMDGIATDPTIGLFDPLGALVVQTNGSAAVSSTRTPTLGSLTANTAFSPGEALVYRAPISGTYTAAILGVAAGPGNYLMSISKNCATGGGGISTLYTFPSVATLVVRPLPPFFPSGQPEIIRFRQNGPDTTVAHGPQVGDMIPGEILSLNLGGVSSLLGPITLKQSVTRDSLGQTRVVSPTQLDSFFDVFVDIDLSGIHLFNDQPIRVQGTHSTQPPQNTHMESPKQAHVFLYDAADPPPGGQPRAEIEYVDHNVNPKFPPGADDSFNTTLTATLQLFPPFPNYSNTVTGGGGTLIRRNDPCIGCGPGGRDTIPTEMLQMSLVGNDPFVGPFSIGVNHDPGYPHSLGQVTGQAPGVSFPADAFFDVFFDVNTASFGRLVTRPGPGDSAHVEASSALGNPVGTIPCGTDQTMKQPVGQQTLLYQPGNLSTPVGLLRDIVHEIDVPGSPGPPPPAGKDCFDSKVTARITLFPPFHPTGCTEDLVMNGPFKVWRGNPSDPGDGRDLISTIMACYQFVGSSSGTGCGLGPLLAHPSAANPSMGQIQSLAPAENFPANSFFDIFTEIETGIGPLHTSDPTHMETTIRTLPPGAGEIYFGPGTTVPLYNSASTQVGVFEVISHELVSSITCPCVCEPKTRWRNNKTDLDVGIPQGGAGVQYDVVRGIVSTLAPNWPGSFGTSLVIGADGLPLISYATTPGPNTLHWLLSRDGAFSQANGTWNSCPQTDQIGDRDLEVPP
jgi:hypothetical protein